MPRFLLTTILFTILLGCLYGQPKQDRYRDQQWLTGYDGFNLPKAWGNLIDFGSHPLQIDSIGSAIAVDITNANICDTNGQLLIYTNGVFVANGQHEIIEGGENIDPTGWAYYPNYSLGYAIVEGCLILPLPRSVSKYYIVHEGLTDSNDAYPIKVPDLRYSLVDMSANNSAGKVMEQKKSSSTSDWIMVKSVLVAMPMVAIGGYWSISLWTMLTAAYCSIHRGCD